MQRSAGCLWEIVGERQEASRGSPMEKSVRSLESELGPRLWIILNVIVFYPCWRKKKMFAMHSTLFLALKQKLRLPASVLEALFMLSQERVK